MSCGWHDDGYLRAGEHLLGKHLRVDVVREVSSKMLNLLSATAGCPWAASSCKRGVLVVVGSFSLAAAFGFWLGANWG